MVDSQGGGNQTKQFEALLEYIRQSRGFDFTGYKRASLTRRVNKRLTLLRIDGFDAYQDYLEVHPEEYGILFNTILVNVTAFFRDPEPWEYLGHETIPGILASKKPEEPVRVWSAGCASGEEPYSLAMLLSEALGKNACAQRVKIYATDVDEDALAQARTGTYAPQAVQDVPLVLREKYSQDIGGHYVFDKDLRHAVIFGRHDLMNDAPISRLDLLVCRNTLMYFNAESQRRILARFHFALNDDGYLFLGKAETLLTTAHLFTPLAARYRVFAKTARAAARDRLLVMAQAGDTEAGTVLVRNMRLRESAFEAAPLPQIVVEVSGNVALINQEAFAMFSLSPRDLGRRFHDLELSYRPLELRSAMEQAYSERRPLSFNRVERAFPDGSVQYVDVRVMPLFDNAGAPLGVSISFADVTRTRQLELDLQRITQELKTSNEELQSSNEELQTTNEEIQSSNEELETTNEELQSANEEMETINEELQSTNEELEAANTELRERTEELYEANSFLRSVLSSLRTGLAVLDHDMRVLHWNATAEDLWGLREDEVRGKHFLALDMGLPVQEVKDSISLVLSGQSQHEEAVLNAVNRRGRRFQCYLYVTPLTGREGSDLGAVLLMEPPHEGQIAEA